MIGIIGLGNLGSALTKGLSKQYKITIFDIENDKIANNLYDNVSSGTIDEVLNNDIVILSLKPHIILDFLKENSSKINSDTIIVSVAAGVTISNLELSYNGKIVRTMPNIPVKNNNGMTAVSFNNNCSKKDIDQIKTLFSSIGNITTIKEELFDAFTAISGSLPAFVYLFIESIKEGGIAAGYNKEDIYKVITTSIKGSCDTFLDNNLEFNDLLKTIATKGGTTIEGLNALQKNNFENTVKNAIIKTSLKSKKLSNK